jgi:hypothetical protein
VRGTLVPRWRAIRAGLPGFHGRDKVVLAREAEHGCRIPECGPRTQTDVQEAVENRCAQMGVASSQLRAGVPDGTDGDLGIIVDHVPADLCGLQQRLVGGRRAISAPDQHAQMNRPPIRSRSSFLCWSTNSERDSASCGYRHRPSLPNRIERIVAAFPDGHLPKSNSSGQWSLHNESRNESRAQHACSR